MSNMPLQDPQSLESTDKNEIQKITPLEIANSENILPEDISPENSKINKSPISKKANRNNIIILVTIFVSLLAILLALVQIFAPMFWKPSNIIFGTKISSTTSSSVTSSLKVASSSASSKTSFSANSNPKVDLSEFFSSAITSVATKSAVSSNFSSFANTSNAVSQNPTSPKNVSTAQSLAKSTSVIQNEVVPVLGSETILPKSLNCSATSNPSGNPLSCFAGFEKAIEGGALMDPKLTLAPADKGVGTISSSQVLPCSRTQEDSTGRTLTCENKNVVLPAGDYIYFFHNNNKVISIGYSYKVL